MSVHIWLHNNTLYVPPLTISVTSEPAKEVTVIILRKVYVRQGDLQLLYRDKHLYEPSVSTNATVRFLRTCVPCLELHAVMKLNDSSFYTDAEILCMYHKKSLRLYAKMS